MKNKKNINAFTLIELLGIIVVLGLIMIILIPKINSVYKDSKKKIYYESTNNLVKAFNEYYVRVRIGNNFNGCSYDFSSDSTDCNDFSFDGTKPSSGTIIIDGEGSINGFVSIDKYTYEILNGVVSDETSILTDTEYTFDYTGGVQVFNVPHYGYYKIELWGASGGDPNASFNHCSYVFGSGGYTSGVINLVNGEKLYIYVGQSGSTGVLGSNSMTTNAFNGGGAGVGSSDNDDAGGGGGGATDIRLVGGNWDDFNSLKSRIMVAGGGAGGNISTISNTNEKGGHAGGLTGVGTLYRWQDSVVNDLDLHATQTTGYKLGIGQNSVLGNGAAGGGAGGGYYGGLAQQTVSSYASASGGGSSYISGYTGCNSISASSTENNIVHTNSPIHYSGRVFYDSVMKAGNEEMPAHSGNGVIVGNSGNGFAKITYIGRTLD